LSHRLIDAAVTKGTTVATSAPAFTERLAVTINKDLKERAQKTREDGVFTLKLDEGVSLAMLVSFAQVRANAERLTMLPVDIPRQALPAGVLTLKNRTLSPVVERFIACAREVAKCLPSRRK